MIRFVFRLLLPLLTFPGIPVHEVAHALGCLLTGTRVKAIRLLDLWPPSGHVLHDAPRSPWRQALIGMAPMGLNSGLAWLLGRAALGPGPGLGRRLLFSWLAVAVGAHAFPSLPDATALLDRVWSKGSSWLSRLVLTPVGAALVILAFGAGHLLLDLAWGLALGWYLPRFGPVLPWR